MLSAPVSFDKNRILRSFSTSILSPRACTSSRPTRMKILRTLLQCRRTSVRSFPIPTRASRRVARRPRLSSTRDESSFLSFWREEVTRRMVSLANNRRGGIVKKSRIARASKETKREDVHDTPGGGISLSKREKIFFSPLAEDSANKPRRWVLLPPSSAFGRARTSLSSIVASPPPPPKKNNTAPKNTAATNNTAPPRGVLRRITSKSASSIRFFCEKSCRPFGARRERFLRTKVPSSSSPPRR